MSKKDVEMVTVNILDRPYQVACPTDEREALEASAKHLDKQMRTIRSKGKVIGLERIAVMAALNTTHELLSTSDNVVQDDQETNESIRRLSNKVEDAIGFYNQVKI